MEETNRVYLRELDCYKNASEKEKQHPLMAPNRFFDLDKLPETNIRNELRAFIISRGESLSPLSIISELYPYHQLCDFLNEYYNCLESFLEVDKDELLKKSKAYLLKNGKNLTQSRHRAEYGKNVEIDADLIIYIKKIYAFFDIKPTEFDFESDIWELKLLPISIRRNPTKNMETLNFSRIPQDEMKQEIKKAIYRHLSQKALGTVATEITAINRFTEYIFKRYPGISSLCEINREIIEDYLIYLNTEISTLKSHNKDLHSLKSILTMVGKIYERKELENLFYSDDFEKEPKCIYKVYSEDELIKINRAIAECDEQVARLLVIHQLLGTRISDVLILEQDCINGNTITINQLKTQRKYIKIIDEDIVKLVKKSINYTNERYGTKRYVFVDKNNPDIPMQYNRVQYQLMSIIQKLDLRNDHGEKFKPYTHIFRNVYGKKLTEMHVDDVTIAKLLGHANTSSVHHYRKVSNEMMAEETREIRNRQSEELYDLRKGW